MTSLPSSGPERAIFIAALRAYTSSCEAPELTPGCPFYRLHVDGAYCGEECMDLLAAHRGDGDAPEVRLSSEITLIQRPTRFRSEVRRPARAYDAREIQLLDSGRSPHVRRAGALLLDLQESLMWKPGVEDAQGGSGVEELLTALEGHGIQRSIIRAPQILDAAAMVIVTLVNLPALVRIERADAEAFDAD